MAKKPLGKARERSQASKPAPSVVKVLVTLPGPIIEEIDTAAKLSGMRRASWVAMVAQAVVSEPRFRSPQAQLRADLASSTLGVLGSGPSIPTYGGGVSITRARRSLTRSFDPDAPA